MANGRSIALRLFAPVVTALVLSSCSLPFGKQPASPKPPTPVSSSSKASSTSSVRPVVMPTDITITSKGFNPQKITVKVNTPVRWVNEDTGEHQVVGDKPEQGLIGVKLTKSTSYARAFKEPGTYPYHCALNPKLKGTVIVTK